MEVIFAIFRAQKACFWGGIWVKCVRFGANFNGFIQSRLWEPCQRYWEPIVQESTFTFTLKKLLEAHFGGFGANFDIYEQIWEPFWGYCGQFQKLCKPIYYIHIRSPFLAIVIRFWEQTSGD